MSLAGTKSLLSSSSAARQSRAACPILFIWPPALAASRGHCSHARNQGGCTGVSVTPCPLDLSAVRYCPVIGCQRPPALCMYSMGMALQSPVTRLRSDVYYNHLSPVCPVTCRVLQSPVTQLRVCPETCRVLLSPVTSYD